MGEVSCIDEAVGAMVGAVEAAGGRVIGGRVGGLAVSRRRGLAGWPRELTWAGPRVPEGQSETRHALSRRKNSGRLNYGAYR